MKGMTRKNILFLIFFLSAQNNKINTVIAMLNESQIETLNGEDHEFS